MDRIYILCISLKKKLHIEHLRINDNMLTESFNQFIRD